jgi:two-component system phosphate regulon sensor histidine kinase PhoR
MYWLLPRLVGGAFALVGAMALSYVLSETFHSPVLAALLGAATAVAITFALDMLPGYRLLSWLRGNQDQPAPKVPGLWGEIGHRFERALRLREREIRSEQGRLAQFLSAIDASPNGVILLDSNDQIEWFSSTASDHLVLTPQRDLKQRITNLVRNPAFVTFLHWGVFDEPLKMPNPRGQGVLLVYVRAYGDGLKLILTQDITERDRAEMMRRDFVANVSHEIRTPLTVLSGFIETMTELQLTEVERKRVMVLMAQQTGRMLSLVSDLLTLAQLEGSPRPAMDKWVPVARLFAQIESDARSLSAGRHQLKFEHDDAAFETAQIAGMESELQSAMANLMTNAIRYTPEGGRVSVSWQVLPDGQAEFAVIDTGPGIDREHIPRLTERFYRVDGSRSRETGGTGLGLSIVKHVAQRHGAELRIASEVGHGSTFSLVFPAGRLRINVPNTVASGAVA